MSILYFDLHWDGDGPAPRHLRGGAGAADGPHAARRMLAHEFEVSTTSSGRYSCKILGVVFLPVFCRCRPIQFLLKHTASASRQGGGAEAGSSWTLGLPRYTAMGCFTRGPSQGR